MDAVLITAATTSNKPVQQASNMSRKRGRLVLVGVAGLELSRAAIREFFGLTPTEAEIAARLADGNNINEIANALDIRPGTVRVHLRSIYRKTRVSRQGELVRLVLCSIARFALR